MFIPNTPAPNAPVPIENPPTTPHILLSNDESMNAAFDNNCDALYSVQRTYRGKQVQRLQPIPRTRKI